MSVDFDIDDLRNGPCDFQNCGNKDSKIFETTILKIVGSSAFKFPEIKGSVSSSDRSFT